MDEVARRLCELWSFAPTEELAAGHCSLDADDGEPSVERRVLQHGLRTLLDARGWSRRLP